MVCIWHVRIKYAILKKGGQMNALRLHVIRSLTRYAIDIAVGTLALSLLLLLITARHTDACLFVQYAKQPSIIHNWFGYWGASLAALLFIVLGAAAYTIAPLLIWFRYLWLTYTYKNMYERLYAALLLPVTIAMINSWYAITLYAYGYRPGGLIGFYAMRMVRMIFPARLIGFLLLLCILVQLLMIVRLAGIRYCMALIQLIHRKVWASSIALVIIQQMRICYGRARQYMQIYLQGLHTDHYAQTHKKALSFADIARLTQDSHEFEQIAADPVWDTIGIAQTVLQPERTSSIQAPVESETMIEISAALPDETVAQHTLDSAHAGYMVPPLSLWQSKKSSFGMWQQDTEIELQRAKILENKLARFGIVGTVVSIKYGPVITLFEYQPDVDAKISKIVALEDDLALALEANSIRIIAPIPGRNVVGFEIARQHAQRVDLADLFYQKAWLEHSGALPIVLGVDVIGDMVIADMVRMPHLLVAGATGAGKSVALNVMLMSLLAKKTPQELQLILIDPKQLEFSPYYDIPHLLFPIITHVSDAHAVLEWLVGVMQERYSAMASVGVRSMADYNRYAQEQGFEQLSYIVVVIDELADLMLLVGREVEHLIARLVQMARAAGIHMVVATQRPSVDVLTGTIKANFSCRLACRVASKIDSRTIIDTIGAEKLLGKGDMLYIDSSGLLRRVHGAYVSDKEVEAVTSFIRAQAKAAYHEIPTLEPDRAAGELDDADMKLLNDITAYLQTIDEISISSLQRAFKIGYNRSARIIEFLEKEGRLLSVPGSKMRKIIK